jgi:hypothetical protein
MCRALLEVASNFCAHLRQEAVKNSAILHGWQKTLHNFGFL